jgi:DNA-binding CsgD family transcriptional regulator
VSAPLLFERERELAVIDEKLREAVAGRGGLVLIEGPAGIGKSALVARARELALGHGMAVAAARGSELERADAFGVVRQLFEPRLRAMSGAVRERALGGAAALAAPVVLPETAAAVTSGGSSFATLHGLYWLLAGFAAERPQLLAVDDVHWADEGSARFLLFLANRLEGSPVLLLAAQRPQRDALRAAPGVVAVTPGALSPAATSQALAGGEADGVAPGFARAVHAATGGNPLLVRRLADGLRERGVPFTDAGAGEIASAGPDVVAGAVGAAMARLGREPVALARAVAILGDEAPLALAAPLAGLAPDDGGVAADQLVRAGILDDGRPLRFQHALVREAVLASLTAGERAQAHRAAARLLSAHGAPDHAIAAQLLHTEPGSEPAVATTLAAEGRRALAAGAPSEAHDLLARALEEPPAEAGRHAVLLALARASAHLGDPAAIAHVRAAYDAAADETERAHAALAVMWAATPEPEQVREALRLIESTVDGVKGSDRELELQLEAARLMMLFLGGAHARWIAETEPYATLEGASHGESLLLVHAAIARFATGRPAAEIVAPIERIPDHARGLAALAPEAPWMPLLTGMLFKTDRLDAAAAVTGAALAEATRSGSAGGFAIASTGLAWIALRRGEGAEAEAHARAAVDAVPSGGWQHGFCGAGLAEVLTERAQLEEATRVLDALDVEGRDAGDQTSELLFSTRSILRMAQGDAAGALEDQREARRRRGELPAVDPDFGGWLRMARLLHAVGETDEARHEARAALEYARRFGTPGYIGQAQTVAGVLAGGTAGLEQLREAVAQLERSPARHELARSLVDLGGALRRDGQRLAARDTLRRALDIAAAGGLTATAELAREELRATGARIRRDHATGAASLTPSERRIAERAAAGASNPEIAQALFVTTKTVEMHLSRAYRKLGISSRDQLPAALAG